MMKEVDREGGALTSDDEEEEEEEEGDSQNLIPQNQPTKSRSFSSFNIAQDEFTSSVYRRFRGSNITSKFCKKSNAKKPSCFYPVPQAADCIKYVVEKANAPVIYLSTDAAESETGLLQSLMVIDGKPVPLIKRPPRNSAEKWDALLYRHGLQDDSQVEAMLDKTICALSSVFIGSSGSTFTEDILRLRKDWGSASVCDEYICQRELPNFIADDDGTEHEH